jgi:chemotaxis protein MotB
MRLLTIACVAIWAVACGPSQEEFEERGRVIDELRSQLGDAERRNRETQAEIDRLTEQNGEMSERLEAMGRLATDLEEARRLAAEYERRAQQQQARLAAFRRMLGQFQAMIDSGRLRVRIVRGQMVIEMASAILFRSGRAELSSEGEETLTQVAEVLRTIPNRHFQVAGHTDNIPVRRSRFGSNWELSTARATTVVQYLQEAGVDPSFLSAAGYSEFAPSGSNDSEEGRAQNRRIEIVLMPNLDELPDLSSLEAEIPD